MGRVALVTGGSRGIGEAISLTLKDAGYSVVATYAGNDEKAKQFSEETGIPTYKFDVGDYDACQAAVAQIESDIGPVEVLVNNAGITRDGTMHKMTYQQWNEVIQTNLTSCFNMCHAVLNGMRERGFGRIVNIGSINGQAGQYGQRCVDIDASLVSKSVGGSQQAFQGLGFRLSHELLRVQDQPAKQIEANATSVVNAVANRAADHGSKIQALLLVGFELQEPARLPVPGKPVGVGRRHRSAAQVLAIGLFVNGRSGVDRGFEVAADVTDAAAETQLRGLVVATGDIHAEIGVDLQALPEGLIDFGDGEDPVARQ